MGAWEEMRVPGGGWGRGESARELHISPFSTFWEIGVRLLQCEHTVPCLPPGESLRFNHMSGPLPDRVTINALVALGHCADDDPGLVAGLDSLKTNSYVQSLTHVQNFAWLCEIPWADACAVVKAIVRAEAARLTRTGGSASAVKLAYATMERRDCVAALELAAWVVDHSNKDYIPFPMRKYRYAFEHIRQSTESWAKCRENLDAWTNRESQRQYRVAQEMANQGPEAERRKKIQREVGVRVKAERDEIQHARASALKRLLTELLALPVQDRLEHIAWDDTRTLASYPAELAVCTADDLTRLDPVTKQRLTAKIRERKKGPWHKLWQQLETGH